MLERRGVYVHPADASRLSELGRAAPSSLADWADRELWSLCFEPQPLIGTTGASDATVARFLAALLRDQTVEAVLST
jgi:sugar/nucleoside kinase (ribokinase family)